MSDRGMKKWAPYKSLPEQDPHLINTKKNKTKIDKPLISSEEAEVINEILSNYHNQNLKITYYKNGELLETTDTIKKIEIYEKRLDLTSKIKILFKDIIKLEEIN